MRTLSLILALALMPAITACAEPAAVADSIPTPTNDTPAASTQPSRSEPEQEPRATPATADPATLVVHKNPSCGCCGLWVDHMHAEDFLVEVREVGNMGPVKERLGIPPGKGSCHTAEIGGYFIEGHVPAGDVRRLLTERPDARGLTVPGMPLGSPGMEVPDGRVQPYEVLLVAHDGTTTVWSRHGR